MTDERRPPDDSWTNFALAVFRMNALIIEAGEKISRSVGQSSARWQVLGMAFQPQTVAEMARQIGHARQSVQRVADVLEREGLVRYAEHPTDLRTRLVELTPEGLRALEEIYARQLDWSGRAMAALDESRLIAITQGLAAIAAVLDTTGGEPE